MLRNALILSGLLLAMGTAPAARAVVLDGAACGKSYSLAAKAGDDLKSASMLLAKAGDCCSTDMNANDAQFLAQGIRDVVKNAIKVAAEGGDTNEAGKVLSFALGCAGQPSIVAIDPTLYSTVLADSADFAEAARDEEGGDGDINKPVQEARGQGSIPNYNQQPTVSIEQK